jgi:hypothetical protein
MCMKSLWGGGGLTYLTANYKLVAVAMWYRVSCGCASVPVVVWCRLDHVPVHPYQWSCGAG